MLKVLKHWTEEEQQIFFKCLEVYGNDFYSYTYHLNRSHSQIKSHYHNWLKKLLLTDNCVYHKQSPGVRHIKFRSFLNQQPELDNQEQLSQYEKLQNQCQINGEGFE
ncbi:Conserved_hypothetical protein [Hexamita inflata]|uniref:HTH myb-type domain-containing protein n=1 Tax=Hexamita inflata TaxID=28002 RepID=A0AA86TH50_9EUKA|nr:Conserved hypothetical protein [Hexamita inflata]